MNEQKVTTGTRFGTMVLDHIIMTMIAMVFSIPGMIIGFASAFKVSHDQTNPDMFGGLSYFGLVGFAVYFCKDCINGRSIGKRILKLQLVDNRTGHVASSLKCFIRNIFCILWPIEGIVALVNPSRRIGDMVAGTKLVPFDPALEQPKPNFGQIAISFGIAYSIMLLAMMPFNHLNAKLNKQKVNFIESSYNERESQDTERLFADSLSQVLTSDVRVYDRIDDENLKYVSVIFSLNENYLENDKDFEQLKSKTIPLLLAKFPEKTFVAQIKYVYQSGGTIQTRTLPMDWRVQKP